MRNLGVRILMNEIKSKSEALKIISEIAKKWWGDCTEIKIIVNHDSTIIESIEKAFCNGYAERTLNGTWLPLKEDEYV